VASDGTRANGSSFGPSISADGRYVAFKSYASNLVPADTNGVADVFVHDRLTGQTTRVSVASDGTEANGRSDSLKVSMSADGRYVAFVSQASNLVPGDTNGDWDVFVAAREEAPTPTPTPSATATATVTATRTPPPSVDATGTGVGRGGGFSAGGFVLAALGLAVLAVGAAGVLTLRRAR
jgi:Tol biopolymer transport system component